MSKELGNIIYKNDTYELRDNSALHQSSIGSWMPDFANLKPISTHEFDIASTSYYKICERANVAAIKDIADEVLAFRITCTGTNIFSITDVVARMMPYPGAKPIVVTYHQVNTSTSANTGIRYLRTVVPKGANTSYNYEFAIAAYNATSRHIKIEVFKAPSAWTFTNTATVYSYNSTYQSVGDLTAFANIGLTTYGGTAYGTYNYANYAGYKSSWDGLFNGQGNFLNAGAAIAANQFVFIGKDNKVYPTTSTSIEIDPAWPIVYCTTAYAANAAVAWSAIRSWGYFTPASSISKDGTLVADDNIYMRCSYRNGKLYSDNTMTQNLTPDDLTNGNTFIKLGKMYTATAVSVNTYNSEYFTLDMDGNIKALNGYLFNAAKADTASTVSKAGSTAAGTYGILFDNNPITSVVPTTTSPRVNAQLTFDPSTGNLTSGIFTGSGAGLTGVPSSGINYDDLDAIDTYEGTSGTGRFVVHMVETSGDEYSKPYTLDNSAHASPWPLMYRKESDSVCAFNGIGVTRRYKMGVTGVANTNNTATVIFYAMMAETPIEVNPDTKVPVNALITDNSKFVFRMYGAVSYMDGSTLQFDTYMTLCYNGSGNWGLSYACKGSKKYPASLTFYDNKVTIVIGPSAFEDLHTQETKGYCYINYALDHLGSTIGNAAQGTDYCALMETRANWKTLSYRNNGVCPWSQALTEVYSAGYIAGIDTDDSSNELPPTKTLHVYHDLDNDTYSFTDDLTAQKIKDILNAASDGTVNLQISIVDVDTSKLLKYYQSGNLFVAKFLIFEDVPAIDMTNYQNHSLQSYFAIVWTAGSDTFQFMNIPGDNLETIAQQFMQLLEEKYNITGGEITGDVILKAAAATDSPALIFQRGTLSDNYNDWRIQDRGGYLRFDQRGNGSTTWSEIATITTTGTITSAAFSGSGASLTSLNASNISSGTLNAARLPATVELTTNKTTTVDSSSTDNQYPSAKAVYDAMQSGGSVSKLDLAIDPYNGTCTTGDSIAAKTVTVDSSFQLMDGVRVRVYMSEANKASSATLNVNDTGAFPIGFFNPAGEAAYEEISTHTYGLFDSIGWYDFIYVSNYGTGMWMLQDRISAGALLPSFKLISNYNNSYLSVANSGLRYSIGTATASGGRPFDTITSVLHMNTTAANQTKELVLSTPSSTSNPAQIAFRSKTNGSWGSWQYALTAPTIDAMPALSYAASGLAFSNKTLTIPIDGTKYKLIQVTVFNNDISAGSLGVPALFSFNAAGSSGYMLNTTTYCIATSAASGITLQFDSSWSMATSPNVDVQVLYRRIS